MNPMVVQCPSCHTEFRLDPAKVPAQGVRARCSVCASVIDVPSPARAAEPVAEETQAVVPVGAPSVGEAQSGGERSDHAEGAAASEAAPVTQESASTPPPTTHVEGHAMASSTTFEAPSHDSPAGESPWRPTPSAGIPVSADHTAVKRSINPFLSKDPGLRAKRLARALVSDIVAYHPAKHAEGLRDGTLKTLFRDEIKKSYEEYVEQVGPEFAKSTTHFQDALNDLLAAGRKLF